MNASPPPADPILSLLLVGDCCSGVPGSRHEANFADIVQAILARPGAADAMCFLGDHISGYAAAQELRAQWRHFLRSEFRPLTQRYPRIHHLPSNHTAYDETSAAIYAETIAKEIPGNVVARKALNYAVREGGVLMVFLDTSDQANNGAATVDLDWLEQTLRENDAATLKLVFGHHPIFPVNGYALYPLWRLAPDLGSQAWSILKSSGVAAYICSHILAFDFQVHDGIAQLCSGGAGTEYGPGGLMPTPAEYFHFVEAQFAGRAIAYQTYDRQGRGIESFAWPPQLGSPAFTGFLAKAPCSLPAPPGWSAPSQKRCALHFSLQGTMASSARRTAALCGWSQAEGPPILWVGFEGGARQLVVEAAPTAGGAAQIWRGRSIVEGEAFDLELLLCPDAGPGGVLAREKGEEWSSLATTGASGLDLLRWPDWWAGGHGPCGVEDEPFGDGELRIRISALAPDTGSLSIA